MDAITEALALWPGLQAGAAVAYAAAAMLALRLFQGFETTFGLPVWASWSRWAKVTKLGVVLAVAFLATFLGTWLAGGLPIAAAFVVGLTEGWKVAAAMVLGHEGTSAVGEAFHVKPLGYGSRYKVSLSRPMSLVVPVPTADKLERIRAARV